MKKQKRKDARENSEFAYNMGWISKKQHLQNLEFINKNNEYYEGP